MNDTIYGILAAIGYFATIIGIGVGFCKLIDRHYDKARQRDTRHKELVDKLNAIERALQNPTNRG